MSGDTSRRWYVVHAYSGFEQQVEKLLKERIRRSGLDECFGEILVPTEEVVEMRDGQRRRSDRKFFPGYVLVHMEMNDETYHLVKNLPKVTGFLGNGNKPTPISEKEALAVLNQVQEGIERPKPSVTFELGGGACQ